jgi:hypothetical protein
VRIHSPSEGAKHNDEVVDNIKPNEFDVTDSGLVDELIATIDSSIQNERSPPKIFLGLDGAHDKEEPVQSPYPILPATESTTPPVTALESASQDKITEFSEDLIVTPKNVQLPTPEATQFSQQTMSRISWSFTTGIQNDENMSQGLLPIDLVHNSIATTGETIRTSIEKSTTIIAAGEGDEVEKPVIGDKVDFMEKEVSNAVVSNVEVSNAEAGRVDLHLAIDNGEDAESRAEPSVAGESQNIETQNSLVVEENRSGDGDESQIIMEVKTRQPRKKMQDFEFQGGETDSGLRRSQRIEKSLEPVSDPIELERPITPQSSRKSLETEASQDQEITPRRSQRIGKSTGSVSEATELESSPTILDDRTTPRGNDVSIEMALSVMDSPTKEYDLRKPPADGLRIKLARMFRKLDAFTALKVLRYHLTQKLEVLAIAITDSKIPQQGKAGGGYHTCFLITDPGTSPTQVTEVHVYRLYEEALPLVKVGDGVLLRNFKVISVKGSTNDFGLKSEKGDGCWAVFKNGEEKAEVRGPHVEYGDAEKEYISGLKEWYYELDSLATTKLHRAISHKDGVMGVTKT